MRAKFFAGERRAEESDAQLQVNERERDGV